MNAFVTGCAGFLGSHITNKLLIDGHEVIVLDNLSTGKIEFLKDAFFCNSFDFFQGNVLRYQDMKMLMKDTNIVFHFSANADVKNGTKNTSKDLSENTIATYKVLEAMRVNNIKKIVFMSTGSVYGNHPDVPIKEDATFPIQTSLYGASKLACEGLIEAYCEAFDMQCWIFRLTSILGERYTHGFCYDFYHQLRQHPKYLDILGNGTARKSYLYIKDFVNGVITGITKSNDKINIFNLGNLENMTVAYAAKMVTKYMNLDPQFNFGETDTGWIGDNPMTILDISKILGLGWYHSTGIVESIRITIEDLEKRYGANYMKKGIKAI